MLEHTLYKIPVTSSRNKNWVPPLTKVPINQSPAYTVQRPESRVQSSASKVQTSASRVHGPVSSVQSLAFSACVQSPGIPVCLLKLTTLIVGKGGHNPPPSFLGQPPFLEVQDVPTFYRPIGKTKVLNESFNWLLYKLYPQSILILEEDLLKW